MCSGSTLGYLRFIVTMICFLTPLLFNILESRSLTLHSECWYTHNYNGNLEYVISVRVSRLIDRDSFRVARSGIEFLAAARPLHHDMCTLTTHQKFRCTTLQMSVSRVGSRHAAPRLTMIVFIVTLGEIMYQLGSELCRLFLPSFNEWRCLRCLSFSR